MISVADISEICVRVISGETQIVILPRIRFTQHAVRIGNLDEPLLRFFTLIPVRMVL